MFAQSRRLYSVSPIKSSTDAVPQHKEKRMPSDIEIAQKAKLERISRVALSKLGIPEEHLEPYGHYKAKVSLEYLDGLKARPGAKMIVVSLGGPGNGYPRQDGFDIVVASEVMAIFCLSTSLDDLKERLGKIVVGYTRDQKPVLARDLQAHGAMTVLLKDAIKPNLVQTLENNPAFIHGGPFANIAHGCNSVIATSSAMKLVDYVVTEAGFGADLGAEKFIDIKCRKSVLRPSAAVIVATVRAMKYHGGADLKTITQENLAALEKGVTNLERHVENVQKNYGVPCVVSINRFNHDTQAELDLLGSRITKLGAKVVLATHWGDGGKGAAELARIVVELCETKNSF